METQSSTRRVTRSITLSALKNNIPNSSKIEESEKPVPKSIKKSGKRKPALIDITNDSPIVGVAAGKLASPSSNTSKQRSKMMMMTPGSGEALLRGQVRSLLQKVEEEAEISKIAFQNPIFPYLQHFSISPSGGNCNEHNLNSFESSFPISEGDFKISQVLSQIFNVNQESHFESEKSILTRSLFSDFSEKSGSSCDDDNDDSSVLSKKEITLVGEEEDEDELCIAINKMSVTETKPSMFAGKHTRFVYDSDDEIVGEEETKPAFDLKGLPMLKGKHLRFHDEADQLS